MSLQHGAPVATLDRETGRVWALDRRRPLALIQWDDDGRVTLEVLHSLLTEGDTCQHGRRGSAGWCGEPTAPGFTHCTLHGGRNYDG